EGIPGRFRQGREARRRFGGHRSRQWALAHDGSFPAWGLSKRPNAIYQILLHQSTVSGEEAVARRCLQRIQDDLPVVGYSETALAGDVTGDEQVGVHLVQEGGYRGRPGVSAPDQGVDRTSRPQVLLFVDILFQARRVERLQSGGGRQAV